MRLVGKRVERLNRYGDDLCIELKDKGAMRISPALKSRMDIPNSGNRVGFAYPESEDEMQQVMMYVAPDGNGVAVNTQGVLNNTPHNRDLRSHYEETTTGDVKLFVAEQSIEIDGFEGYKFFKIKSKAQINNDESFDISGNEEIQEEISIEEEIESIEESNPSFEEVLDKRNEEIEIEEVENLKEINDEEIPHEEQVEQMDSVDSIDDIW